MYISIFLLVGSQKLEGDGAGHLSVLFTSLDYLKVRKKVYVSILYVENLKIFSSFTDTNNYRHLLKQAQSIT